MTAEFSVFVRRTLFVLFAALLFVAVSTAFVLAPNVFLLGFTALLLAVALRSLAKPLPLPYGLSLALVTLLLAALFIGFFWFLGPSLGSQFRELTREIPTMTSGLLDDLEGSAWGGWILERLPFTVGGSGGEEVLPNEGADGGSLPVQGLLSGVMGPVTGLLRLITSGFSSLFLVLLVGIFLASAPSGYLRGALSLLPPPSRQRGRELARHLYDTLQAFLLGQFISMVTIGVLAWLGLTLLGVPYALSLGFVAFLFEFIPTVGPWLAGIPAVLVAFTVSPGTALWVVVFYAAIQLAEGNLIHPVVQQKMVDLPPAVTLLALFLMGSLFGFLGVLVAAPLAAVVMTLVKVLLVRDRYGDEVDLPAA